MPILMTLLSLFPLFSFYSFLSCLSLLSVFSFFPSFFSLKKKPILDILEVPCLFRLPFSFLLSASSSFERTYRIIPLGAVC